MKTDSTEARLEELQSRFLNDPLEGPNGENYSSDWGWMLNLIYRLRDDVEDYKAEQEGFIESIKAKTKDLEAERKNHATTLDLFEKAIAELVSWREAAKANVGGHA
jgi:hypothetical protein